MHVEMNTTEGGLLIAALCALEDAPEVYPPDALALLRPFRSALLEAWLRARILEPPPPTVEVA